MKITFLLFINFLLAFNFNSLSQKKIEILLIGTSHNYELNVTNDFDYVKDAVRNFKPDIFCTEYLSKENEPQSVIEAYYGERMTQRRDLLLAKKQVEEKDIAEIIKRSYKTLKTKPDSQQARMDLAHALYLSEDLGNAHFQIYQLMKADLGKEENEYLSKVFDVKDSLIRYTCRKNNEYTNLVFPLAVEMNIQKLYGFDCQRYDALWNLASDKSDSLYTAFEEKLRSDTNDLNNKKSLKTIDTFMKEYLASQKRLRAAYREGTQIHFFNTKEFDDLAEWGDFLREDIYQLEGFPLEAYQEKRKYWQLRNEQMVQNTLKIAKQNKAKKIVVFVGASHRRLLSQMFERNPNVSVQTIDQVN
ncbi:hypothetical protein ABID42_003259 [Arcicella rosea]|uniref:DUF5694 domain-containing protein n=1 Tax=Arcicella rosea TaxID=502909 RepID=UPI00345C9D56